MSNRTLKALGKPDLVIAGWKLWVVGRDAEGWLRVWTTCESAGRRARTDGAIVYAPALRSFLDQLKTLDLHKQGTATLDPFEPNLRAEITVTGSEGAALVVRLSPDPQTPDSPTQHHEFQFEIDPACVPEVIRSIEQILH